MRDISKRFAKRDKKDHLNDFLESKDLINPRFEALRISIIYGIIGLLWVLLSDRIAEKIVHDPALLRQVQTYKGWFYVTTTMVMVYILIRNRMSLFMNAINKVYEGYEEVAATHEELVAIEEELREQFNEVEKHRNALMVSDQRYRLVVEGANDGIWDWDLTNGNYYFSIKWKSTFGYEDQELENTLEGWKELLHPDDRDSAVQKIEEYLSRQKGIYQNTYRLRCKNGSYRWILSRGKAVWDKDGKAIRVAGSHTDMTEHKVMEHKLHTLAYYDTLTGLPNRVFMEQEMSRILKDQQENKSKFALIYLDIDNFKHINDTVGHSSGNVLIKDIANILKCHIKSPNLVVRLGGDEFAILLNDISDNGEAAEKVEFLLNLLKKPWILQEQEFFVSASVGVTVYPDHGTDLTTLFKNADAAMFAVKDSGKDGYSFYSKKMEEKTLHYIQMINQLRYAIDNDEFALYYQPLIDLETGTLIGVEALIRWIHPQKGFIPPAEFIPLAEETGHIHQIGKWVFKTACKQKKEWSKKGYSNIQMSINLSSRQLTKGNIVTQIGEAFANLNMSCCNVHLEVTETAVMNDMDVAIQELKQLRSRGLKIVMDDFGTGYSSLTYLKKLPIDIVKMDREFIKNFEHEHESQFIIQSIIQLAHVLNIMIVAEGIETVEQLNLLKEYGCDIGQGYLFCKPVPAEELEKMLAADWKYIW
ncbi:EAL domain-containing protein [Petroclostridium sp. X23]|uniref:putative bifunctional diguanylate cyclase/phosphodiesterase n=1 Tax=Petroclostridium sp. X23 TaxID=3045146 RepID=UPI0024AD95D1|nr:EAL domain-containing protein [Petroclostridium sp. X23]WHH61091.1 EAL domain-containing protein [Petroclostridium sp. X23]